MPDSKSGNEGKSLSDLPNPQNGGSWSASPTWRCPREELLAAYLDGTMEVRGKIRLESHLADCERCRMLVADIVKLRRLEAPLLPLGLMQRAIMLGSPRSRPRLWRWIFVPAAATAAVLIAIVLTNLRTPQPIAMPSPVASLPVIAKSETPPGRSAAVEDVVREGIVPGPSPTVISPQPEGVIAPINAKFRWSPVAHSRYYDIRLTRLDGDLIWEAKSEKTLLHLPGDITLKNGSYFVWVTAYLQDGRVAKSQPTKFWVNDSP